MPEIKGPFVQYKPGEKINPFVSVDPRSPGENVKVLNKINSSVGNYVYFKADKYDLYVPLNDTIVVDELGRNIVVYDQADESLTPANERNYLILCATVDGSGGQEYLSIKGRQNVFDTIVDMADVLDFQESIILAETTALKDAISLFEFMKMCVDKELVENRTGFDPYEYGDYVEV